MATEYFTNLTHGMSILLLATDLLLSKAEDGKLLEFIELVDENWRTDPSAVLKDLQPSELGLCGARVQESVSAPQGQINILGASARAVVVTKRLAMVAVEASIALKRGESLVSFPEVTRGEVTPFDGNNQHQEDTGGLTLLRNNNGAGMSSPWMRPSEPRKFLEMYPQEPPLTRKQFTDVAKSLLLHSSMPVVRASAVIIKCEGSQSRGPRGGKAKATRKVDSTTFTKVEGKTRVMLTAQWISTVSESAGLPLSAADREGLSLAGIDFVNTPLFATQYMVPTAAQVLVWFLLVQPSPAALGDNEAKRVFKLRMGRLLVGSARHTSQDPATARSHPRPPPPLRRRSSSTFSVLSMRRR